MRAQLFDPSITEGARIPTLADLDAPNNPFFMIESNGHIAYTNSVALRLVGVTRDTADPPQARFGLDANGNLTGRLEETGALDPFIQKMLIQKALVKLLENRTGLVIAHRLATIREADGIIVLQNGQLIEMGNHDQLMANGKLYAKLYNLNYSSFDDIPDQELEATAPGESPHD